MATVSAMVRRLPWWVSLLLGLACVVLGAILTLRLFSSLSVLVAFVAICSILSGLSELATADTSDLPWLAVVAGLGWIAVGIAAAVWPGITIHALAILAGISMIVGGLVKLISGLRGESDDRLIALLRRWTSRSSPSIPPPAGSARGSRRTPRTS